MNTKPNKKYNFPNFKKWHYSRRTLVRHKFLLIRPNLRAFTSSSPKNFLPNSGKGAPEFGKLHVKLSPVEISRKLYFAVLKIKFTCSDRKLS